MKIAIISGASAGLGKKLLEKAIPAFSDIEEYWLISRSLDKLKEVASVYPGKSFKLLPLDLCSHDSFKTLSDELEAHKHEVRLLINNAGCGFLNNVGDGPLDEQLSMVDLNIRALTAVTHIVLPYIPAGGHIINISSIASFCPNPRMTVYSSTKAYVSSFSRGLWDELKSRKISVTAVCSGPMDTEFIYKGNIKGKSKTFDTLPYCDPDKVAAGAVKAALKGKAVYTPRAFYKLYRILAKLIPHAIMINASRT
ncbi:MAG: SDR family NAD(P)-dependent oxidoreductase [Oscillospiraceae bacterium]|nr:SDR family NAD(P)-dependent oxidoreductase [Oscillospiraceae bacterium]